jgi:hypothetical protein
LSRTTGTNQIAA